ncbi:MAG TPA: L-histidine N(alpha)-methyltransferase [Trebonia sp.]
MLTIENRLPADFRSSALRADVSAGLNRAPKSLSSKWFYAAQEPAHLTADAERSTLSQLSGTLARLTKAHTLVELGPAAPEKTRLLLDALHPGGTLRSYVGVDADAPTLIAGCDRLARDHPHLAVRAVVSDFHEPMGIPASPPREQKLVTLLGSRIGNMVPAQRAAFFARVRSQLRPGDALLLGTDLVKNPRLLAFDYHDSEGVAAARNKNVLFVLNSELGANFDPDAFEHVALWVPDTEWMEMRLRATSRLRIHVPGIGQTLDFAAGEEMRTVISAKFRRIGIAREMIAAGLAMRAWWADPGDQYGLSLATRV